MINILIDHTIFLHQKNGGISKYFCRLQHKNNSLDKDINIKIFSPITVNENLFNLQNKENIYYLKLEKIPKYCSRLFYFFNNILTLMYIKFYKPDLLHLSYFNYSIIKYIDIPYILTIHDLIHEKYFKSNIDKKKYDLINNAKKIICVSKNTKKDLINFYKVDSKKISVIYHGIDITIKKEKKFNKKNNVLFIGDRRSYKNFPILLRAFSGSDFLKKNYKIVCFGGGNFNKKETSLIKKLNLSNSVNFFWGDDYKLFKIYQTSKVLVYPSSHEGFGIPIIEALANKCAVITSNIDIFREILLDPIFFFNNNDEKDLSKKLEKLLKSKHLYNLNLRLGYKIIRRFSLKKNYLLHKNLYMKSVDKA
jgi:glycosyltransferase involved in cell wall biosynthesis